jgi:hypothetical protein
MKCCKKKNPNMTFNVLAANVFLDNIVIISWQAQRKRKGGLDESKY